VVKLLNLSAWEYVLELLSADRSQIRRTTRVVVHPNDHRPAHVHVIGRGCEAVFDLNCPAGPVQLRENYSFRKRDLASIENELAYRLHSLCTAWESIHGIE
jgi:hypothetical protein